MLAGSHLISLCLGINLLLTVLDSDTDRGDRRVLQTRPLLVSLPTKLFLFIASGRVL
jgi:hypothetical protein